MSKKDKKKNSNWKTEKSEKQNAIITSYEEFAQFTKAISRKMRNNSYLLENESKINKRRKNAAINLFDTVQERYGKDYELEKLQKAWGSMCGAKRGDANLLENTFYFFIAIAIYILDEIYACGKLPEALQYLNWETDDVSLGDTLKFTRFADSVFDEGTIAYVVYLLQHRNGDEYAEYQYVVNKDSASFCKDNPDKRNYSEIDGRWSCRARLDALIDLVPEEVRNNAKKAFEEKFWEYVGVILKTDSECVRDSNKYAENAIKRIKMSENSNYAMSCAEHGAINLPYYSRYEITKYASRTNIFMLLQNNEEGVDIYNKKHDMHIEKAVEYLVKSLDIFDAGRAALMCGNVTSTLLYGEINVLREKDRLKPLLDFTIQNPFEICLGYFCLLDDGYDIPWMYLASEGVLCAAISKLPWLSVSGPWVFCQNPDVVRAVTPENAMDYGEQCDSYDGIKLNDGETEEFIDEDFDECEDSNNEEEAWGTPETTSKVFDVTEEELEQKNLWLYGLIHEDKFITGNGESTGRKINWAQLMFYKYSVVVDRDTIISAKESEMAKEFELSDEKANMFIALSGNGLCNTFKTRNVMKIVNNEIIRRYRKNRDNEEDSFEEDENIELEEQEEETGLEPAAEREYKEKIKALQAALHKAEKKAADAMDEAQRVAKEAHNEHNELVDLRDINFSLSNKSEPDEEANEEIVIPYQTKRKIVAFGGHTTWSKAIIPMLPNVTFVDKDVPPSPDLIRHADVVWIQANALCHANFYKIIKIIRDNDIPVHYFKFASAEKCARQLITEEQKEG